MIRSVKLGNEVLSLESSESDGKVSVGKIWLMPLLTFLTLNHHEKIH